MPNERPDELISIYQAAERGIERIRQPNWANKLDHLKINIVDGKPGPWLHLYSPFNKECNGRDPVNFLIIDPMIKAQAESFEVYKGPLPDSDEYKAAIASFDGCLSD